MKSNQETAEPLKRTFRQRFFLPWTENNYTKLKIQLPKPANRLIRERERFSFTTIPRDVKLLNGALAGIHPKAILEKSVTAKRCPTKQTSTKWLAKIQPKDETQLEMLTGEVFRIMLGADVAPKYRFSRNHDNQVITLSRLLPNFSQFFSNDGIFDTIIATFFPRTPEKLTLESVKLFNNTPGLEHLLAVCLLFGKIDLHRGNWGVVTTPDNNIKTATTVDHGSALSSSVNQCIWKIVSPDSFRKELIVTSNFIQACKDAIAHYENYQYEIEAAFEQGIASIEYFYGSYEKNLEDIKFDIQQRIIDLNDLCTHIECEIAILENNPEKLKKNASKFSKTYIKIGIFSFQDNKYGTFPCQVSSHPDLIKALNVEDLNSWSDCIDKTLDEKQQKLMDAWEEGFGKSALAKI